MTRVFILVNLFLMVSLGGLGQCVNPPTISLSSTSSSTCGTNPVTVNNNIFGGSATTVTIKEDGNGSVSPVTVTTSPFSFTYTPKSVDAGKKVIITLTTNDPSGPCTAAIATYTLTVNANPAAPHVGTVTMPTCGVATGSVVLSSLPSAGIWKVTRTPGGVTTTGTGTSTTVSGIPTGTYTFTVTSSVGCTSSASSGVVINSQPVSPASPTHTIDCTLGFGKASVNVTSPTGTGLQYRLDAGAFQSGTSFANVANGSHSVTVRNASGCTTTGAIFEVSCGCVNQPSVHLGSSSASTCGITPLTLSNNTFGGSATSVTITENGAGTVSPLTRATSPFEFTYTPAAGDAGNTVIITVTTNNPLGLPCAAATATCTLTINANPSEPITGVIVQPTCSVGTGGVSLSGLPASGSWRLTRNPGGVITTGSGTSTTISGLPSGTYTFTVTNSVGCISPSSANVVIPAQPVTPSAPLVGTIVPPTCSVSTGSVVINGLPTTGTWNLTRYPGTVTSTGTGTSSTISGLPAGTYNFMVTNSGGCVSVMSANVVIPPQPVTPPAPLVGAITQPGYEIPTGSVVLSGLPASGSWILTLIPGNITTSGTGISKTISDLGAGTYYFTVTNSAGCTSGASTSVVINTPSGPPVVIIANPSPVCFPSTVDLTAPEITSGSTSDLTFTYWTDADATYRYNTPSSATAGTYYIKGTTTSGFFTIKPVNVTVDQTLKSNAGPDQILELSFETTLDAELIHGHEKGYWSLISGSAEFFDSTYAKTSVNGLALHENKLLWTLNNGVCPATSDTIMIIVHDLIIPTLITPNMDGKNDFFILRGLKNLGKTGLTIFNRSGVQVFKIEDYDNSWNGVDNNGDPLSDDTYFYVLRKSNGKYLSGYIVIRR